MEPKRTLHSGNLVGDRKLFMIWNQELEDGRVFILLRDGVHKIDGGKMNQEGQEIFDQKKSVDSGRERVFR